MRFMSSPSRRVAMRRVSGSRASAYAIRTASRPCRSFAAGNARIESTRAVMEVGFYGKLPSHGDFLRRRVSDAFVGVWDGWLQECIAASRTALGARWLDLYL